MISNRKTGLLIAAIVALVFGALTVFSGGRALFGGADARAAVGDAVPFVLWFNFLAGFAYVVAGIGLLLRHRPALWLSLGIGGHGVGLPGLRVHVLQGGAEMRTVGAMILRIAVWAAISVVAIRNLGEIVEIQAIDALPSNRSSKEPPGPLIHVPGGATPRSSLWNLSQTLRHKGDALELPSAVALASHRTVRKPGPEICPMAFGLYPWRTRRAKVFHASLSVWLAIWVLAAWATKSDASAAEATRACTLSDRLVRMIGTRAPKASPAESAPAR